MKKYRTQKITAAEGTKPDEALDDFIDVIEDDFAYAVSGLEALGRGGVNSTNDALAIAEKLQSMIQSAINEIAEKVAGE